MAEIDLEVLDAIQAVTDDAGTSLIIEVGKLRGQYESVEDAFAHAMEIVQPSLVENITAVINKYRGVATDSTLDFLQNHALETFARRMPSQ